MWLQSNRINVNGRIFIPHNTTKYGGMEINRHKKTSVIKLRFKFWINTGLAFRIWRAVARLFSSDFGFGNTNSNYFNLFLVKVH